MSPVQAVTSTLSAFLAAPPGRRRKVLARLSLTRSTTLTLALLTVIAAVAAKGICDAVQGAPLRYQYVAWAACGMLVLMAIVVLLIGRILTQRSLLLVERQLRALAQADLLAPAPAAVPDDLRPVMDALFAYVERVRTRMNELRIQQKELDIQMRFADTERQNAEAIIFSISDAVLVVDSFGALVLANTAAERLFGIDAGQSRSRPLDRVLTDGWIVSLIKDARSAAGQGARRQVEYTVLKDGLAKFFNVTLSTVVDHSGQARGVVAVFHDITRERENAQIKNDFVSAVSHEMRTPLSSIKAYVEMLVDDEAHDDQTRRRFYRIIESETDRLQRLISNILNISRIESGVVEVHRQRVQVNQVVRDVAAMMGPQANEKNITVACELDESLPAVRADRDMLHQAVLNVMSNAIKYTRVGGTVRVSTAAGEDARHVAVTVRDNGVGIRPEDLPRIFDKFYRSPATAGTAKGTGLGLNLVKHIVETVHRGEICVASEPGAGTTFVLRFPFMASRHQELTE